MIEKMIEEMIETYIKIGYILAEAYNREGRLAAVNAERERRRQLYRDRVKQYPSSPKTKRKYGGERRLDKEGKPLPGSRNIAFKEPGEGSKS